MMNEKAALRKKMLDKISSFSVKQKEIWSAQIASRLYELEEWKAACTIGVTISMAHEVDTYHIIKHAWKEGKNVAVPKCHRETRMMTFHVIQDFTQLETVYMNLKEPIPEQTLKVAPSAIDLLIVPGIAFTNKGERLGYGGGYYDRFLSRYTGNTVALAFSFQVVPKVPMKAYDRCVQKLITEQGVIGC
ncbi:MAG: 5-formyltetrahydrofolate cyclo-ligase [Ectobacillus sp.]